MRTLLLSLAVMAISVPLASAQNWSGWRADDTYHGIEVRARCTGYNEFAGRYLWDVQLRNRYQKSVDVAWAAEPQKLHGAEAQSDRAVGVAPGETVDAHHTAPVDCSSGLTVRVNEVRESGNAPRRTATAQAGPRTKPEFQAHWASHDPAELQKSLTVQVYGDAVTSQWLSPNFSFEITAPLPKKVTGAVSVDTPAQK